MAAFGIELPDSTTADPPPPPITTAAATASNAPPPIADWTSSLAFPPSKEVPPQKSILDEQREKAEKAYRDAVIAEKGFLETDIQQGTLLSNEYNKKMKQSMDAASVIANDMKPWDTQKELAKRETSLWEAFGSPGFLIAMMGSAFSARPMNSALEAGAAAMHAIKEGNDADYQKAMEAWKANTDLAMKRLETEQKHFQNIETLRNTNFSEYQARMREVLAMFDDKRKLALLDAGLNSEVDQAIAGSYKARDEVLKAQQNIENNEVRRQLTLSFLARGDATDPKKVIEAKRRAEQLMKSATEPGSLEEQMMAKFHQEHPDATFAEEVAAYKEIEEARWSGRGIGRYGGSEKVQSIVQGIVSGRQPPRLSGLYSAQPAVRAGLEEQGFDLTKAQLEYQAAERHIASMNGPQITRFMGLANSVVNTIDRVSHLADEMQLSGVPALNNLQIQAYIKAEGNSPNGQLAATYIAAVNTLKEEFANLATGGYAPHEAVWKLANDQINADYGVHELNASLREIQRLINYRIHGILSTKPVGTGGENRYLGGGDVGGGGDTDPFGVR
jgi:hypothetical protein